MEPSLYYDTIRNNIKSDTEANNLLIPGGVMYSDGYVFRSKKNIGIQELEGLCIPGVIFVVRLKFTSLAMLFLLKHQLFNT